MKYSLVIVLILSFIVVACVHGQPTEKTLLTSIVDNLKPELVNAKPRALIAVRNIENQIGRNCETKCNNLIDASYRLRRRYSERNSPKTYPTDEMEDVTGQSLVIGDILFFSKENVAIYTGNFQMAHANAKNVIVKSNILNLSPEGLFKKVYRIKKRVCGPVCRNLCRYGRVLNEEGCPTCGCLSKPKKN